MWNRAFAGFRALALIGVSTMWLSACSGGSEGGSSAQLVNESGLTLNGSVGDGPVTGAAIRVLDASGSEVATATADSSANYAVEVPPKSRLPLTVEARGGTDLVTGQPLDFALRAVVLDPTLNRVNISPISTVALRIAECRTQGTMSQNFDFAVSQMSEHFGMGLDPTRVPDPFNGVVDARNIADIVLANEALGEALRRTHNALQGTPSEAGFDALIGRLACDLASGGGVDASGGGDARTVAAFHAATASVLIEVAAGRLHVNGVDAMAHMDAASAAVEPQVTMSVSDVPLHASLVERARQSLAVLHTTFADEELARFMVLLAETPAADIRSTLDAALDNASLLTFDGLAQRAALASDADLALLVAAAADVAAALPPNLSLAANPTSVAAGASTLLTWASTGAQSCLASGDWSGEQETEGNLTTGGLTMAATYALSCVGLGGSVTQAVTVDVQAAPTAPTVTLSANPTQVAAGSSSTLSWSSTNATACTASGGWNGTRGITGSAGVGPLSVSTAFVLSCTGAGGSATASANVTVNATPTPAPTLTLTANPTAVAFNGSTTLSWTSVNASSCTASGDWTGNQATSGSATRNNLTANRSYTLTCSGGGGSIARTVNVSVAPAPTPAPTLTFAGNPASVAFNGSTALSWTSGNATSCTASGDWSGNRALSGNSTQSGLTANRTYNLTCQGAGGSIARTVNIAVGPAPAPAPTLTFTASPTSVAYNGSATLAWTSANATSCTASGDWSGSRATSGSATQSNLTANRTYTLTCQGTGGSIAQTASVAVAAPPVPAPTLTLAASPTSVAFNGSSTLSWSSTNATSCTASGGWSGSQPTSGSSVRANLTANTTFTLACTGAGGTISRSASVTVAANPAPTVTLSASPPWIAPNTNSTLNWSSANATSCSASGGWSGSKATTGSQSVGPLTADATYTLTCSGSGGNAVSMASVGIRSARLSWTAPTQNVDGSPLTDLTGYKIYYGNSAGNLSNVIPVSGATNTQSTVTLTPGTWYFALAAVSNTGESAKTNVLSKTVN